MLIVNKCALCLLTVSIIKKALEVVCDEFEALIVWPLIKLSKISFFYEHSDQVELRRKVRRALWIQAIVRFLSFYKIELVIEPIVLIFLNRVFDAKKLTL